MGRGPAGRDRGPRVAAVEWQRLVERAARQTDEGWIPVHHVQRFLHHRASRDMPVPSRERHHPHAPLVQASLAVSERHVFRKCALCRQATVVTGEDEECAGSPPLPLDGSDDPPDARVHLGDHACVGVAPRAEVLIGLRIRRRALERTVWRMVGDVQEERFAGVAVLDPAHGLVGHQVGDPALVLAGIPVPLQIVTAGQKVPESFVVGPIPVRVVEAARQGEIGGVKIPQMPFS